MRKKIIKILFLVAIVSATAFFGRALAIGEDFFAEVSPKFPGPNMPVNVSMKSYSIDVDRSYITWSVNGTVKLSGRGEKAFNFKTGDAGKETDIFVSLKTEKGLKLNKTLKVIPAEVDLLWEVKTYTPAPYKGKAMPVPGSLITVTAIPRFGKYSITNPSNFVYYWKLSHKNQPDYSGTGKNSFTFRTAGPFNESTVGVKVSNYNKKITAENSVKIKNLEPKLIFYEDYPLEGPSYNTAIGKMFQLKGDEVSVRAEPFFFSFPKKGKEFSFNWAINGKKIKTEKPNVVNLRVNKNRESGQSTITLNAKNLFREFQFANNNFMVNFGQ